MTNYKSFLSLTIIGFVGLLAMRYVESILTSLIKIFGMIFYVNHEVYVFLNLIPELLVLTFWILVVFKFLKEFSWTEPIKENMPKKLGVKFGITVIVLYIFVIGLTLIENNVLSKRTEYYLLDKDALSTTSIILTILNFIEVIIIIIGFIKIINKKSRADKT